MEPKYKKAKGSAGISGIATGIKGAPKVDSKSKGSGMDPAGIEDSRVENSDRTQSAK